MSDLQCPARILLVRGRPDQALAVRLGAERVVAEYDGPVDLVELADRHRGEAILVVGEHRYGEAVVVLVEIDADGLRARPWDIDHA